MDENLFRIVVTVAVALAALAFVVQAGIVFAIYRTARKTQRETKKFLGGFIFLKCGHLNPTEGFCMICFQSVIMKT